MPIIQLSGRNTGECVVSAEDYEGLSRYVWHSNGIYAVRYHRSRPVLMHRQLLGLEEGDPREGDHINGDQMDNRRENLRIVTRSQNRQNLDPAGYVGSTSKYRAVHWAADKGKWRACVRLEGKRTHLGYFDNEDEAGRVAAEFIAATMPFAAR